MEFALVALDKVLRRRLHEDAVTVSGHVLFRVFETSDLPLFVETATEDDDADGGKNDGCRDENIECKYNRIYEEIRSSRY